MKKRIINNNLYSKITTMNKYLLFALFILPVFKCAAQTAAASHTTPETTFSNVRMDASGNKLAAANDSNVGTNHLPISGGVGCPVPMSSADFDVFKSNVARTEGENYKVVLARETTNSNCLLSEQIETIVALFSNEQTKLAYAELAYDHAYDKADYYRVYNSLQQPSILELSKYIHSDNR